MKIIDTHQHFWKYNSVDHDWITDDMQVIRKDFLPQDLASELQSNYVDACIAVQANQTEKETEWLLQLANENEFISAVVGWVDLRSDKIDERLQYFSNYKKLKGFRHVLQGEDPSFMLQKDFLNGISKLQRFGFTYDLLVFPHHLEAALQLVEQFPLQPFVIDHAAKPLIKEAKIDEWKTNLDKISQQPNVYCKLSGMVTEANWKNWIADDLKPYLDTVVHCFGIDRILFGSDWPVCLVASSYNKWLNTVKEYFASYSNEEQEKVFCKNAMHFYNL